jgi:type II secretory pathway predicted ATPase ExeA
VDLKSTFGMHSTPFTREVHQDGLFTHPVFDAARDGLLRSVEKRMSAALISPPGTGKTTVLRATRARLPESRYRVHYVRCVSVGKREMCREIARVCGLPPAASFPGLVSNLQQRFETCLSDDGLRPVLLLDDAHDLRPDVLSVLRVLTNYQMDSRLVLSVVLAGHPDLGELLARDDQDAVARRIVHYATLRPLSRDEVAKYVEHRCSIAGSRAGNPFDSSAIDALYEIGRGNLRITDNLALEALEIAARAKLSVVGAAHVAAARKVLFP